MIRVFENKELNLQLQTINKEGELYFKAKEVALALGYQKPRNAIEEHVSEDYKKRYADIKGALTPGPLNAQPHSVYLTEPGLYELIFSSKLPAAEQFRRWVFSEVLPSIRKTGSYTFKSYNPQMFKIENEFDLHKKVVDYIRRFYPNVLFIAGLGELQDRANKRITAWQKGYQKGQPDIIITSYHKPYSGLCLEFKTPKGNGVLSDAQKNLLDRYSNNSYKTMVCNDYDLIIRTINEYCAGLRLPCQYCGRGFLSEETLSNHLQYFHRLGI